jgi:Flp pilus assembly protein TadG
LANRSKERGAKSRAYSPPSGPGQPDRRKLEWEKFYQPLAVGVSGFSHSDKRQSGETEMLRKLRSGKGQSLVEFVVVLPVFLLLMAGIVDFGMGFKSYLELTNATREGARFAVVGNPAGSWTSCSGAADGTVVGRVCETASGLDLQSVSVTYPGGETSGNSVVVEAQYRYNLITPLGSIMQLVSGGSFPGYFDLSSSSDMRLE